MSNFTNEQVSAMLANHGIDSYQLTFMSDWLDHTHGTNHMDWGSYLMYWAEAKDQFLTKLFGGQLIHKFPFNITKSAQDLIREMNEDYDFHQCIHCVMEGIEHTITSIIQNRYYFSHCEARRMMSRILNGWDRDVKNEMIERNYDDQDVEFMTQLASAMSVIRYRMCHSRTYAENAVDFSCRFSIPGSRKPFQVCNGQKPIKVLTNLIKYLAPLVQNPSITDTALYNIEALRLRHSQLLNTKNFHGQLCLSIHPMDYMTMSDNGCDWHSCMRWEDGAGEYHAGTLEMMTSTSVVVAYLESDKAWAPIFGDSRCWSNKKWRELFVVTPKFMSGIKGYPYESESLEAAVLNHLMEMASAQGIQFDATIHQSSSGDLATPSGDRFGMDTMVMYNDTPYTTLSYVFAKGQETRPYENVFYYGEGTYCIQCGKLRGRDYEDSEGLEDRLWCQDCDDHKRCVECGDLHAADDMIQLDDGRYICTYCYDEYFHKCEITGEWGIGDELNLASLTMEHVRRNGAVDEFSVLMSRDALIDNVPKDCREKTSYWSSHYTIIKPLPEDNEICQKIMAWFKDHLGEDVKFHYRALVAEEMEAVEISESAKLPF